MALNTHTISIVANTRRLAFGVGVITLCTSLTGCVSTQAKFESPEKARDALIEAVRSDKREHIKNILGSGASEVISSGDEVADEQARARFLASYDKKNSLAAEPNGAMTLQVGEDDWPLPIPIVKRGNSWRFDTRAAKEEILNRRIGRNELATIQTCLAVVDAQQDYFKVDWDGDKLLEYAQKFVSDTGTKNGLYWRTDKNEPLSPLGELAAEAAEEGYGSRRPKPGERKAYHGYHYKLLTAQGPDAPGGERQYLVGNQLLEGFAVVAWPAIYGNSGIMTFIVNHNGVVFERDLGRQTDSIASKMTEYNPDDQWQIVSSQ